MKIWIENEEIDLDDPNKWFNDPEKRRAAIEKAHKFFAENSEAIEEVMENEYEYFDDGLPIVPIDPIYDEKYKDDEEVQQRIRELEEEYRLRR